MSFACAAAPALTDLGAVHFDDIRIKPLADRAASEILTPSATLPDQTAPGR